MKVKDKYFNVVVSEGSDSADILLYGYIGQEEWWRDSDENDITDLAFAKTLRNLEKTYSRVNIRINSPGGSVYHGNPIVTAIKNSTSEIHTYIDGMAASMAAPIWLAGNVRHMATNAVLMFHSPSTGAWGNAQRLRSEADFLDVMETTLIACVVETTDLTAAEAKAQLFDYKDHWLNAKACADMGLINGDEEYEVETDLSNVQNLSYKELMAKFSIINNQSNPPSKNTMNLIKRFMNSFKPKAIPKTHPTKIQNSSEMTKEELKQSITDGTLTPEEVADILRDENFEVTAPQPPADPQAITLETITNAIAAGNKVLEDKITAIEAKVNDWGDGDGAKPTGAQANQDPPAGDVVNTNQQDLDAYNQEMSDAASGWDNPFKGDRF